MLCCRCRRESPPGKFCAVCGGLLHAVPLSGKMPEPNKAQTAPPPAQPPAQPKPHHFALFAAAAVILLAVLAAAILLILR